MARNSAAVVHFGGADWWATAQSACRYVGCPEFVYHRVRLSGELIIQHGENPEHQREFETPLPMLVMEWFDAVHERAGYTYARAAEERALGRLGAAEIIAGWLPLDFGIPH